MNDMKKTTKKRDPINVLYHKLERKKKRKKKKKKKVSSIKIQSWYLPTPLLCCPGHIQCSLDISKTKIMPGRISIYSFQIREWETFLFFMNPLFARKYQSLFLTWS
jgi:hypothetical protein